MILIINNINDSFSARPEELISSYDEFILDDELKAVTEKIFKTLRHLFFLKPILDNQTKGLGGINYLEYERQSNKLPNILFEIEVNF